MHNYLFILLLSVSFLATFAQNKPYSLPLNKKLTEMLVDQYTIANGLPSNILTDIYQGKDGYLWLTSFDGIIRFDGLKFKIFNKLNTPIFTENSFIDVEGDDKGRIYFLSNKEIFLYENNHFEKFYTENGQFRSRLSIDCQGRLWIANAKQGLFYFQDKQIIVVLKDTTGNNEFSISSYNHGDTYITNRNNIYCYSKGVLSQLKFTFENISFIKAGIDETNLLWIVSDNGIYSYDGQKFNKNQQLNNLQIWNLYVTQTSFWIQTDTKIFRKANNSFEEISHPLLKSPNYKFLEDFEGNFWITADRKGLLCFRKPQVTFYPTDFTVNTIYADTNEIIAGGDKGQIRRLKNGNLQDIAFQHNFAEKRIRHISKDNSNHWWISEYKDLERFDKNGKKTVFLKDKSVRLTFHDRKNFIWVTFGNKDLYVLQPDQMEFRSVPVANSSILSINEDKNGNFWLGTAGEGLFVMKDMKIVKQYTIKNGLFSNTIFNIYIDSENYVWLCCNEGFTLIKNDKITNFTMLNGLPSNQIYDVLEDDKGNFFMPYTKGIMMVNRKNLNDFAEGKTDKITSKIFDKEDGVLTEGFTPVSHSAKSKDGKLYFPATDGIFMLDTKILSSNSITPKVYIEHFFIDNDTINLHKPIEIAAGKKNYKFGFTTIHFYAPKKIKFKYRLDGFDSKWTETDYQTREANYTNLSRGKYTFQVIASNNDGLWNTVGESISFVIQPFWYETWWARISAILLVVFSISLFYKVRIKQLKRNQVHLEQIVKERTFEIQQQNKEIQTQAENLSEAFSKLKELDQFKEGMTSMIVHDLKNPLNAIINTPERYTDKEKLEINRQYGQQMLNLVLNILDVNKYEETKMTLDLQIFSLFQISVHAIAQIQFLATEKSITLKNNINQTFTVKADAEIVERIFINLLTNAIKYSNPHTEVLLDAEALTNSNFLCTKIKDSGKGIPAEKRHLVFAKFGQIEAKKSGGVRSTGIGLTFCKMAIEAHHGEIDFISETGKGTTFWFTLPKDNDIKVQNEKTTTINLTNSEIILQEHEKIYLSPFVKELKKYEIYEITSLLEIVEQIEDKTEQIKRWKSEIIKIIYKLDEVEFNQFIELQ
jgi:signal transduction histidine kinase/ligand-binding sensor domain-containing protein